MPEQPSSEQADRQALDDLARSHANLAEERDGFATELPLQENALFRYLVWRDAKGRRPKLRRDAFFSELLSTGSISARDAAEGVAGFFLAWRRRAPEIVSETALETFRMTVVAYVATGWAWGWPTVWLAKQSAAAAPNARFALFQGSAPNFRVSLIWLVGWSALVLLWEAWAVANESRARLRWAATRAADELYPAGSSPEETREMLGAQFMNLVGLCVMALGMLWFYQKVALHAHAAWFYSPNLKAGAFLWAWFSAFMVAYSMMLAFKNATLLEGGSDPEGFLAATLDKWVQDYAEQGSPGEE